MQQPERQPDDHESRAAVALTVAWMLTCMSTAVGMVVVLGLRLLMIAFPVAALHPHPLGRMAGVLLFCTIATGVICVGLTPLVYRVRSAPPPRPVTIAAVAIGLAPLVLLALLSLMR